MHSKIFCLIGPSGSGKTTVEEIVLKQSTLQPIESLTTRERRPNDLPHYVNIPRYEFETLIANDELIEWKEYAGNYYGTRKKTIDPTGKGYITIVELNGYQHFKDVYGAENVFGIYLECSPPTAEQRMVARGDDIKKIKDRLDNDLEYFKDADKRCSLVIPESNNPYLVASLVIAYCMAMGKVYFEIEQIKEDLFSERK